MNNPGLLNCITSKMDVIKRCVGCTACKNICPTQAIEMRKNCYGFFNPVVNEEKCINCGLCFKKCIKLNPEYNNNGQPECFAAQASDEIRKVSSSGGVFSIAAEKVFANGGYVCGAAYKENSCEVEHIIISKKEDLYRMRGSKYIQSDLGQVYLEIKKLLSLGKMVLFSGLPCQVAGLNSFLKVSYEKLITIELICHGISSYELFEKYHQDVLSGKKIDRLDFKAKEPWGWHSGINAYFEDGSVYRKPAEIDPYFRAYLGKLTKNKACGDCTSQRLPRQADLTIGDFWCINSYKKELNDHKGTSVILVNNKKGKEFLDSIRKDFKMIEEAPLKIAILGNPPITTPYRRNKYSDLFLDNFNKYDFSELTEECLRGRACSFLLQGKMEEFGKVIEELKLLGEIISKNKGNRKVVLWGWAPELCALLKKQYDIDVAYRITVEKKYEDGIKVRNFESIKNKSEECYVIAYSRPYTVADYQRFIDYGYTEIKDFVYKNYKPIVLENFNCEGQIYSDIYGNTIEGINGLIKKVIFSGYNNHIFLGKNIYGLNNVVINCCGNTIVSIGDNCSFSNDFLVESKPYNGYSKIEIGKSCKFMRGLIRTYNSAYGSNIIINEKCTFGDNLELRVNSGKKIIVGKDCMFSYDVLVLSGDGHSLFDIKTKKNKNSIYLEQNPEKNKVVIGDHVWIGWGTLLMAGTNIGNGSVVGARSVVKNKYPNNCTIGGNPAKLLSRDVAWSREMSSKDINSCGPDNINLTSSGSSELTGANVLVIGGTKFMGIELVWRLLEHGNSVTIATRGKTKDEFGYRVKRIKMDLTDEDSVKKALEGKEFDVVFDNLAYCSNYVKNVLSCVKCRRYIQISSVAVYLSHHADIKESEYDPFTINQKWCDTSVGYQEGKRQAEAAVYQKFPSISAVTVRIPYVTKTDRLYYFCKNIVNQTPMKIEDISKGFTFIQDKEVAKFLTWIAAQNYKGPINISSSGMVTIQMLLDYIEKRTGKKAILNNENGELEPFSKDRLFTMNTDRASELGYNVPSLHRWFWELMDEYINRVVKENKK